MTPIRPKITGVFRALLRLTALAVALAQAVLIYALVSRHRQSRLARAQWLQDTCRRILAAVHLRVETHGERPSGGIVTGNHTSYLDILVLAALTPAVFVAKSEVAQWPVFGWFARKAGTRFIDRSRRNDVVRISAEIGPVLHDRLSVVVFLEGTSTDGQQVLPFKPSLLEPAIRGGWTVTPVALRYEVPAPRSVVYEVAWWGNMTLVPHLWNLATLPWISVTVNWGTPISATGRERKALAAQLHAAVIHLKAQKIP